ncbi:hypothetical protein [Allokutzneria albata]|uniref:SPW repeat-containing protein n=1 Tax=Allokutzneria albata TaxID=211114 RepID=A0A1H0CYV2_ALLAB|nr:hypothetical protein [Allokutzneria albata]SDN63082.1 hypothetical protein SAMN04489726_7494 [Allokutzneria albata]
MSTIVNTRKDAFLRTVMKVDAVGTGANGAAYLAASGLIGSLLGVPAGVLAPVGAFLLAFAIGVWFIGTRAGINPKAVWGVALVNMVWAVDSLVVAFSDWFPLTGWGLFYIVFQAVVVGALGVLQVIGLRRITR